MMKHKSEKWKNHVQILGDKQCNTIECTTLGDKPIIVLRNAKDREILKRVIEDSIIYISKEEKDIDSFLEYLQEKLEENRSYCTLDRKYGILRTKNYNVIGKNIYGNRIGTGYEHCLYYCFSSKFDKSTYAGIENKRLEEILMHTRQGAKELSELEIMYMLGLA